MSYNFFRKVINYLDKIKDVNNIEKLLENMDNFYNCTNLSLTAYNIDGNLISTLGETYEINLNNIKEMFLSNKDIFSIEIEKDTYITIAPLYKKAYTHGFYAIGPFSQNKNNSYIYKPLHCISHLIELLYKDLDYFAKEYNLNIEKAVSYIKENYSKELSLEIISKELNINKSYFSDLFKKTKGESFIEYLNKLRIEESKKLLRENKLSLLDISMAVGFSTQNYFNTVFKKIVGITPTKYRKDNILIK